MKKRLLCIALCLVMTMSLCSCSIAYTAVDELYADGQVEAAEAVLRLGFSRVMDVDGETEYMTVEELCSQSVESSSLRSSLFYSTLSEEQRTVYSAIEYAMENSYCSIYVDGRIAESYSVLETALLYLSLDSPFLEQNLKYETGTFTQYIDVNIMDLYTRSAEFSGYYIYVDNFTEEMWNKKLEALERASEVVEALPEGLTEMQRSDRLYRYVTENVTYTDYGERDPEIGFVRPFLYDALITGKTNCDGFANAYALLLRLAGVENAEKVYGMNNDEVEVGHTWNVFLADGVWYNADGTNTSTIPPESDVHAGMGFGFSDELQGYEPDCSDMYAECAQGAYITVDARLPDTEPYALEAAVLAGYEKHGGLWTMVLLDSYDDAQIDTALQNVANELQCSVYHAKYERLGGKIALYVCDPSIIVYEE